MKKVPVLCHPGEAPGAHGLCKRCYNREYMRRRRESKTTRYEGLMERGRVLTKAERSDRYRQAQTPDARDKRLTEMRERARTRRFPEMVYEARLMAQCGRCAICGRQATGDMKTERLYVDHHHGRGHIRGLLCHNCNLGLGNFQEDVTILRNAIAFLEE